VLKTPYQIRVSRFNRSGGFSQVTTPALREANVSTLGGRELAWGEALALRRLRLPAKGWRCGLTKGGRLCTKPKMVTIAWADVEDGIIVTMARVLGLCWTSKYKKTSPLPPEQLADLVGRSRATLYRHLNRA